jgi:hypothetical protein
MIGLFQRKDAKAQRRKGWQTLPSWSAGFSPLQHWFHSRPRLFAASFPEQPLKRTEVRGAHNDRSPTLCQLLGMPLRPEARQCAGFTFKELIIVVVLVPVLLLVTGVLFHAKPTAKAINCINNVKQIGCGFRLWAGDFGGANELYPAQISTNSGGAMELLAAGEVWPVFQAMSNDLATPKVLICPADTRKAAAGFGSLRNTNLSYFVSRDAGQVFPESVLIGDRNLEVVGAPVPASRLTLTTNQAFGWTTNQHIRAGNVGLADGSGQQMSNARFQDFLRQQQPATNRIVIP